MNYNLAALATEAFEELSCDLIGRELQIRFQTFRAGPDGGVDGLFVDGDKKIVLQAKRYINSEFSDLKKSIKRESCKVEQISPDRYILATSLDLTEKNKKELSEIIKDNRLTISDIYAYKDLLSLMRKFNDVALEYPELWKASATVMGRIVHPELYNRRDITRQNIINKKKIYVENPSFKNALRVLSQSNVLIIYGPPGVGKTTLAEMLIYHFLESDWELIPIESPGEAIKYFRQEKRQLFYFDDFLGRTDINLTELKTNDPKLAKFIKAVKERPNTLFVLTTRGHLLQKAKRCSEEIGEMCLDVSKFLLKIGVYSRRVKAQIFYNHLCNCNISTCHIKSLIGSGHLPKIIDHRNYNPRVIEAITKPSLYETIPAEVYADEILKRLNNPKLIWETAFDTHLDTQSKVVLIALFFHSERGVDLWILEQTFEAFNAVLSDDSNVLRSLTSFENSLRDLENGFISIHQEQVTYINPSLKDYIADYLKKPKLLFQLVRATNNLDSLSNLWNYVKNGGLSKEHLKQFALTCSFKLELMLQEPYKLKDSERSWTVKNYHVSIPRRLLLVLDWWQFTGDVKFSESFLAIVNHHQLTPLSWRDEAVIIDLFTKLCTDTCLQAFPNKTQLLELLLPHLSEALEGSEIDELVDFIKIFNLVPELPEGLEDVIYSAAIYQFEENTEFINGIDSVDFLNERIDLLEWLADDLNLEKSLLAIATQEVNSLIDELFEQPPLENNRNIFIKSENENMSDKFDDAQIIELFDTLVSN